MADENTLPPGYAVHIAGMQEDLKEIKGSMARVAEALERLARMEERQANSSAAIDRAFGAIEKVSLRVVALELLAPSASRAGQWIDKAGIAAAVFIVMMVLRKVGIA